MAKGPDGEFATALDRNKYDSEVTGAWSSFNRSRNVYAHAPNFTAANAMVRSYMDNLATFVPFGIGTKLNDFGKRHGAHAFSGGPERTIQVRNEMMHSLDKLRRLGVPRIRLQIALDAVKRADANRKRKNALTGRSLDD